MFRVYGSGTARLAARNVGDRIHLFGPLGNGFPALPNGDDVVMAAGGIGLPPLYFLTRQAIADGFPPDKISFIAGARTALELLNEPGLLALGINHIVCTDDGTLGARGTVVDILENMLSSNRAPRVFACGPNSMLREVDRLLGERRLKGYLSLEALMPCGYGICSGCAVKVHPPADRGPTDDRRDYHLKRVCAEGPVFGAGEVVWD
jgi:dihydroorotate dehydrogenase electron transfer subunit